MRIRTQVKLDEPKLMVMASKPTLGEVKCFIKRLEIMKKIGVINTTITATHFGTFGWKVTPGIF